MHQNPEPWKERAATVRPLKPKSPCLRVWEECEERGNGGGDHHCERDIWRLESEFVFVFCTAILLDVLRLMRQVASLLRRDTK